MRSEIEVPKKKINKNSLKQALKLYKYIKPYRFEYMIGILCLFGSSLANLAFPKLLGDMVNAGNNGSLSAELNRLVLLLACILIIQAVFAYFRVILFVRVTEKSMADLRQATFAHLIRLPLKFFERRRVGELNSRVSADITMLQETFTGTLADFIREMIIIIGGIALLAYSSPGLTIFMLIILPPSMLLARIFGRFIRKFSKQVQNEVADSNTVVEETLQGIQGVKAFTNEYQEMKRYKKLTDQIAQIGIKSGRYRGAFSSFIIVGIFGAMVAVIWRGSHLLAAGVLEAGKLFSFVIYSVFVGGSIGGLAGTFTNIQKFLGATEDLFEILKEEREEIIEVKVIEAKDILSGDIELRNLSFAYPSRSEALVLKDLSVFIEKNQVVALVGPSGAGKSTLATLLLKLHGPTSGQILFDNRDSESFDLAVLRKQIALVPQDIFLFGGSIQENIAYGKPDASTEEIIIAAKRANAWEFIEQFPEKMDTIVGERGTQLSGGQRQRVAIARALLKDPKILILDEATSALDSESERLVQEALEELMKGRTSIVIAHRLSTIRNADQILVLQEGRIVEKGTHQQLIQHEGGIYRNLSQLQFAG